MKKWLRADQHWLSTGGISKKQQDSSGGEETGFPEGKPLSPSSSLSGSMLLTPSLSSILSGDLRWGNGYLP